MSILPLVVAGGAVVAVNSAATPATPPANPASADVPAQDTDTDDLAGSGLPQGTNTGVVARPGAPRKGPIGLIPVKPAGLASLVAANRASTGGQPTSGTLPSAFVSNGGGNYTTGDSTIAGTAEQKLRAEAAAWYAKAEASARAAAVRAVNAQYGTSLDPSSTTFETLLSVAAGAAGASVAGPVGALVATWCAGKIGPWTAGKWADITGSLVDAWNGDSGGVAAVDDQGNPYDQTNTDLAARDAANDAAYKAQKLAADQARAAKSRTALAAATPTQQAVVAKFNQKFGHK